MCSNTLSIILSVLLLSSSAQAMISEPKEDGVYKSSTSHMFYDDPTTENVENLRTTYEKIYGVNVGNNSALSRSLKGVCLHGRPCRNTKLSSPCGYLLFHRNLFYPLKKLTAEEKKDSKLLFPELWDKKADQTVD